MWGYIMSVEILKELKEELLKEYELSSDELQKKIILDEIEELDNYITKKLAEKSYFKDIKPLSKLQNGRNKYLKRKHKYENKNARKLRYRKSKDLNKRKYNSDSKLYKKRKKLAEKQVRNLDNNTILNNSEYKKTFDIGFKKC